MSKTNIPKIKKQETWNFYVGEDIGKTKCMCCSINFITSFNFHCGHVVARSKGGSLNITNLRAICSTCNLSMGNRDMISFMKDLGYDTSRILQNENDKMCLDIKEQLDEILKMSREKISIIENLYKNDSDLKNYESVVGKICKLEDSCTEIKNKLVVLVGSSDDKNKIIEPVVEKKYGCNNYKNNANNVSNASYANSGDNNSGAISAINFNSIDSDSCSDNSDNSNYSDAKNKPIGLFESTGKKHTNSPNINTPDIDIDTNKSRQAISGHDRMREYTLVQLRNICEYHDIDTTEDRQKLMDKMECELACDVYNNIVINSSCFSKLEKMTVKKLNQLIIMARDGNGKKRVKTSLTKLKKIISMISSISDICSLFKQCDVSKKYFAYCNYSSGKYKYSYVDYVSKTQNNDDMTVDNEFFRHVFEQ